MRGEGAMGAWKATMQREALALAINLIVIDKELFPDGVLGSSWLKSRRHGSARSSAGLISADMSSGLERVAREALIDCMAASMFMHKDGRLHSHWLENLRQVTLKWETSDIFDLVAYRMSVGTRQGPEFFASAAKDRVERASLEIKGLVKEKRSEGTKYEVLKASVTAATGMRFEEDEADFSFKGKFLAAWPEDGVAAPGALVEAAEGAEMPVAVISDSDIAFLAAGTWGA